MEPLISQIREFLPRARHYSHVRDTTEKVATPQPHPQDTRLALAPELAVRGSEDGQRVGADWEAEEGFPEEGVLENIQG